MIGLMDKGIVFCLLDWLDKYVDWPIKLYCLLIIYLDAGTAIENQFCLNEWSKNLVNYLSRCEFCDYN